MTDLPDSGPFTFLLIGTWWPAAPDQPTAAVNHWFQHSATKQQEAQELDKLITLVSDHNSGRTADDMVARLRLGKKRLLDIAHQCRAKSEANKSVANAENHLRDRLKAIADDGNHKIDQILKRQGSMETKLPEVNAVIAQANSDATSAGTTALNAIADATQQMFDDAGVDANAREWLQNNGGNFDAPPPQRRALPKRWPVHKALTVAREVRGGRKPARPQLRMEQTVTLATAVRAAPVLLPAGSGENHRRHPTAARRCGQQ